jgi:hypothetical protein
MAPSANQSLWVWYLLLVRLYAQGKKLSLYQILNIMFNFSHLKNKLTISVIWCKKQIVLEIDYMNFRQLSWEKGRLRTELIAIAF